MLNLQVPVSALAILALNLIVNLPLLIRSGKRLLITIKHTIIRFSILVPMFR